MRSRRPPGTSRRKWPYAFPLFGDKVSEQGIKMPLPFGIGVNYAYANQPIEISRIAVAVNDGEYVDLSELIKFDELSSTAHLMNLRADLWLLPFMNVYGMANYIVESQTSVSIVEPFAFDAGATQQGAGGGFGMTFAGGIWGLFATLDLNWTWNKMENLNDPVPTFLLTPRIGQNLGKVGGVEFIVWGGAMRQRIASETKGSINLRDAVGGAADGSFQEDLQTWYEGLPPGQQAIVGGIVGRIDGERDPGDPLRSRQGHRLPVEPAGRWGDRAFTRVAYPRRVRLHQSNAVGARLELSLRRIPRGRTVTKARFVPFLLAGLGALGALACDDVPESGPPDQPAAQFWDNRFHFLATSVETGDGATLPLPTDFAYVERLRVGEDGGPPVSDVLDGAVATFELDGRLLVTPAGAEALEDVSTNYVSPRRLPARAQRASLGLVLARLQVRRDE